MSKRRTDTDDVAHFRAGSRIFRLNDEWYFSSREGEHGPWKTEQEAARELETYVKLAGLPQEEQAFELVEKPAPKRADPKVWDRFNDFN